MRGTTGAKPDTINQKYKSIEFSDPVQMLFKYPIICVKMSGTKLPLLCKAVRTELLIPDYDAVYFRSIDQGDITVKHILIRTNKIDVLLFKDSFERLYNMCRKVISPSPILTDNLRKLNYLHNTLNNSSCIIYKIIKPNNLV